MSRACLCKYFRKQYFRNRLTENEAKLSEDKTLQISRIISSILTEYYEGIDHRIVAPNDTFNDSRFIAGEDGEIIFQKIAHALSISDEEFFEKISVRKYFEKDIGLSFLPIAILSLFLPKLKEKDIKPVSVLAFSQHVFDVFGDKLLLR